ncbi:MAG: hypothetical protein LLG13_17510 [Bacteroidales bacterium]|nr:hypothetical protein [Bacteroidales bacterium]
MKKLFTLIFLVILGFTIKVNAQNSGDMAKILQKCIDLPELQQYIPRNSNGSFSGIYVLQHGVSFPANTEAYKSGMRVQFINKDQLASGTINNYFLFWELNIEQNSAKVDFVYHYPVSGYIATQRVILELQKSGDAWNVTDTKIQGGRL